MMHPRHHTIPAPQDEIENVAGPEPRRCSADSEVVRKESIEDLVSFLTEDGTAAASSLAEAPRHTLCTWQAVDELAAAVAMDIGNEDLRRRNASVLAKLRATNGRVRRLRRLPDQWRSHLDALERSFPNFRDVLNYVRAMGALAELHDGVIKLDPMLYDGTPGTGKSTFAEQLAKIVAGGFQRVQMSSAETGAQLGGSAASWANSQAGQVFDLLVNGKEANPVILLDELDKAMLHPGERFSPVGPLYQLLEPSMARTFRDISVPTLEIDASAIVWMATSNDRHLLPAPILSRLLSFDIPLPRPAVAVQVVHSVLRQMADAEPVFARFQLSAEAAAKLAMHGPRAVRSLLRRACGSAAQSACWTVHAHDVPDSRAERAPMGFRA